MSVYVDTLIDFGWKLGPSCHMFADSVTELHQFAKSIDLKKEWVDISATGLVHYDLVESKRNLAIKKGAIYLERKQAIEKWKELKAKQ